MPTLTKNMINARYSNSAHSNKKHVPSRFDHLTWRALNKNTDHRIKTEITASSSGSLHLGTDTKKVKLGGDHSVKVDKESGTGGARGGRELVRTIGSQVAGSIIQPAYTTLKRLEIIFDADMECSNTGGGGTVTFKLTSGATNILHVSTSAGIILGNGGTVGQYQPIVLVDNFQPMPATTGALANAKFTLSSPFTDPSRTLIFTITVDSADLQAPSAGTNPKVTVIGHFAYVSDNH